MSHPFLRNLTAWERVGMELRGLRGKVHGPTSSPEGLSEDDNLLEIAASGSVSGIVLVAAAIMIVWRFFAQIKVFLQKNRHEDQGAAQRRRARPLDRGPGERSSTWVPCRASKEFDR